MSRKLYLKSSMLAVAVVLAFAMSALAIAPNILPGFPMRAGQMVMIMWTPVPGATNYKIMRRAEGGEWQMLMQQPAPPFNDMAADMAITYDYQIIPIVGGADGEASAVSTLAGVKKLDPPVISGNRSTQDSILLRWKPVTGAVFYNVYRAVGDESGGYKLLGSVQDTKYEDPGLTPDTKYLYQLTSVDSNSTESPRSEVSEVMTQKVEVIVKRVEESYEYWTYAGDGYGEDGYELKQPLAIAVDNSGFVHVVDFKSIQVLNADGEFVRRYGFNEEDGWGRPGNIFIDSASNTSFVSYFTDKVVRSFNLQTGEYIRQFSYQGYTDPNGNLIEPNPNAVTVDSEGYVYIADSVLRQIIVFPGDEQEPIARVGRPKYLYVKGEDRPASDVPGAGLILYSPIDNTIIVGDKGNASFTVFDPAVIKAMDPEKVNSTEAEDRVIDIKYKFGGQGSQGYNFNGIASIVLKDGGRKLYIGDNLLNKVKIFTFNDETKQFEYTITMIGDTEEAKSARKLDMGYLSGCDYNESMGRLYCSSVMNNQVYIFVKAE